MGLKWRALEYSLLGDDIVIKHNAVALEYKKIMAILGVEVSVVKTHDSAYFFEFAKRLVYKNVEVSPFPLSALQEIHKKNYLLVNLLIDLESRGWISKVSIPVSVSEFARTVLHRKAKNIAAWKEQC